MKLRNLHNTKTLEFFFPDYSTALQLPFIDAGISGDFLSLAHDFIEWSIDLNKELIKVIDTIFFAKMMKNSMKNGNINEVININL